MNDNIDFEYYEGAGDIIYSDDKITVMDEPCFYSKKDYKYFAVWIPNNPDKIRIDMKSPRYFTGKLSNDDIIYLISVLAKPSLMNKIITDLDIKLNYRDYNKNHVHTVWEDLNYFNDCEKEKDIDILPIPDYTKLNR